MRGKVIDGKALTISEALVYDAIHDAAKAGLPCPQNIDIEILTDSSSSSMGPTLVRRLEEKGLIVVRRFQRWRQVLVVPLGLWTAAPDNLNAKPHVPRGHGARK